MRNSVRKPLREPRAGALGWFVVPFQGESENAYVKIVSLALSVSTFG